MAARGQPLADGDGRWRPAHDDDAGAQSGSGERGPIRRCVVSGERQPKEAMIRLVLGPGRTVVPDIAERLPGRGLWLCARGAVLEDRGLARALARAAKGPVSVPEGLRGVVEALLAQRIADLIGLARRAGQAVAGFVVAREWVSRGRAGLVIEASDGAEDGRRKLLAGASVPVVTPLTAQQLGAVFGRDHAVHVAVAAGRLADAIARDAARLAGVRGSAQGFDGGNRTG